MELGVTLAGVRELPHAEYVGWRAFWVWREAQRAHARDVADMRARTRS